MTLATSYPKTGGPGSEKTKRLEELIHLYPTWKIISMGSLLWKLLEEKYPEGLGEDSKFFTEDLQSEEDVTSNLIKNVMRKGDMLPKVK